MERLLTVRNLRIWFDVRMGLIAGMLGKETKHVRAVDGISFDVKRGEVFCLVGESGCGKTTTGKGLIRLNEPTDGNIFFDVPEQDWSHYISMYRRLREVEPRVEKASTQEQREAEAAWKEIRALTRRIETARNPPRETARQARRERYENTKKFLDEREQALLNGVDPMVTRVLSKGRLRSQLMETQGAWFTPPRARKLELSEKRLKEARYQLVRAQALQSKERKFGRLVKRLERRIERMRKHIDTGDPETRQKSEALRAAVDEKGKRLTELELTRVRKEREQLEPRIAALAPAPTTERESKVTELEARLTEIRERGGLPLEALELRARMDTFRGRFDLARWGRAGQKAAGPRRGRRKRYRLRMRELRRRVQIIYQDPYESLNPKLSIYDIVAEPLLANRVVSTPSEAQAVVQKALEDVGLRPANEYMFRYPHELSGGQRQRVGIATALVVDPDFIVADEPVSMLDASVRTEILALLLDLKKRRNLTYLFITHDLGLAWILADRIAVMYLGKIVETGDAPEVIRNPRHPYTKALISVVPSPNPSVHREKTILRGERPNPVDIPKGCRFHPRCPAAVGICGWDSEEVQDELEKLLAEDRDAFPAAPTVTGVEVVNTFALRVATTEPANVEAYLRKRMQAVALQRPALGAIRTMKPNGAALDLVLHKPAEPWLQRIQGDVFVACHLVTPELVPDAGTGTDAAK